MMHLSKVYCLYTLLIIKLYSHNLKYYMKWNKMFYLNACLVYLLLKYQDILNGIPNKTLSNVFDDKMIHLDYDSPTLS